MDKILISKLIALALEDDSKNEVSGVPTSKIGGSKTKIVVLQRGWVVVGTFGWDGEYMTLTNASTIRVWGTTKGLGELATNGKTDKTVLDSCGTVRFHPLTTVQLIDCNDNVWNS
jgi:hypothetical protein